MKFLWLMSTISVRLCAALKLTYSPAVALSQTPMQHEHLPCLVRDKKRLKKAVSNTHGEFKLNYAQVLYFLPNGKPPPFLGAAFLAPPPPLEGKTPSGTYG
mmetsp:Transcript_16723/g.43780  ORF Transcript_16723/g.43780 Transcript_16723/m.43780 type:complete len:101 (-) Transcript_16723:603-905(-)